MKKVSAALKKKLSQIRLIASDIDGVLTDGRIILDDDHRGSRHFNALDGMGIQLAGDFGIEMVFISGKLSGAAQKRLKDLGVRHVYQDIDKKGVVLDRILKERGLEREAVCAVGDDLSDLPLLARAGVSVAVCNAVSDLRAKANWTTQCRGGDGALREVVDEILKAKGLWPRVLARFVH